MNVTIVQRILPEYRLALFEEMQRILATENIQLSLLHGQESKGSTPVTVKISRSWATKYKNIYLKLGKTTLVVQLISLIRLFKSDLIVVEQANSLLLNYILILFKPFYKYKIAFWGHGFNRQAKNSNSISEKLKSLLLSSCDWWFSYTSGTTEYLLLHGVTEEKITTLRNTIDTKKFSVELDSISPEKINLFLTRNNLVRGKIALYCGGLTKAKEIDFLLEAALLIKDKLPDFSLIIIGSGPEQRLVEYYVGNNSWIRYLGSLYGIEKALVFKCADCLLIPGQVGLVIIDSIVAEKPIVVRDLTSHGPEIEYIQTYRTGLFTKNNLKDYCNSVIRLLSNPKKVIAIQKNCLKYKHTFHIEHMANTFCTGIKMCLKNTTKPI